MPALLKWGGRGLWYQLPPPPLFCSAALRLALMFHWHSGPEPDPGLLCHLGSPARLPRCPRWTTTPGRGQGLGRGLLEASAGIRPRSRSSVPTCSVHIRPSLASALEPVLPPAAWPPGQPFPSPPFLSLSPQSSSEPLLSLNPPLPSPGPGWLLSPCSSLITVSISGSASAGAKLFSLCLP